ncbi:MAG: hypothetical protein HY505_02635 [Candidatus Yanofskybacteria bacterium]|nr:hypothetical protein [Candidatus Yanofskybacteria bacterium]
MDKKFKEFLEINQELNKQNVVPVIYGSLGLYHLIGKQIDEIGDIDIVVPNSYVADKFGELKNMMIGVGYSQDPNYMHEFTKGEGQIGFEPESDLVELGIDVHNLKITEKDGAKFKELSASDYLKVYNRNLKTWEKKVESIKKKITALEKIKN